MKGSGRSSVLLSYSHLDKEEMEKLQAQLRSDGVHVVVDERDVDIGADLVEELHRVSTQNLVVVLLSPNSVQSDWVKLECGFALAVENFTSRVHLIPAWIGDQKELKEKVPAYLSTDVVCNLGGWLQDQDGEKGAYSRLLASIRKHSLTRPSAWISVIGFAALVAFIASFLIESDASELIQVVRLLLRCISLAVLVGCTSRVLLWKARSVSHWSAYARPMAIALGLLAGAVSCWLAPPRAVPVPKIHNVVLDLKESNDRTAAVVIDYKLGDLRAGRKLVLLLKSTTPSVRSTEVKIEDWEKGSRTVFRQWKTSGFIRFEVRDGEGAVLVTSEPRELPRLEKK